MFDHKSKYSDEKVELRNGLPNLSKENPTKSNAIQIPEISLPKGGGALKGIDEKFEVNPANGTASFSIPLPVTPGRNNFSPSLSLSYNSGGGNSPYGLGWSVGYPMIQRKTDKRLPRYRDGLVEDTFMFSGAEDLVPYLEKKGEIWVEKAYSDTSDELTVKRYRPRIEGGFARIEKIHHSHHGVFWKVTTRENIATIFGRSVNARIANPEDTSQIFKWMPEFSYDDKGNWIKYEYKKEDLINVPNEVYEKNRINDVAPFINLYLKRVKYGNRKAYYADSAQPYDPEPPADNQHFFELVMDYGEHDTDNPKPDDNGNWNYRKDAFSSYRSGFEIRTNRLCKRILMFHHFEGEQQFVGTPDVEEFEKDYLVRSLDLEYEASSINNSNQAEVTYLKSIKQSGYIRKPNNTGYSKKSLPPMEFSYQSLSWNKTIKTASEEAIVNAPVGLTNNYQWVDLYGEGISGILTEQAGGWFYKSNIGDVKKSGDVAFTRAQEVVSKPSFSGLSTGDLSLQDLAANGEKQLVVNNPNVKGFYELTHDNNWKPFKPFESIANINLQDPKTRMIDLNGDGQPELVVTEENVFVWYAADGKRGHLPAEFAHKTFDEEKGPAIVFADQEQTIFLADMAGDGLTDIVRIRNGEICYWSNMGYGKFSAKITMSNAPQFDHPDQFNPQYIHLADVSGTGATDIIYVGKNKFKAYINLSGNAWTEAHEIEPFFPIDGNSRLSVVDLMGTGTSCIVWSSDLPANAQTPMRFIDLMGGKMPHVMTHYKNNMGMETSMEYKSSTKFYLEDKLAGTPWITKLPFPVQVVSKMTVEEKITNVRFATSYKYHHGYYDHPEREFRGFGMVEQLDTEFYETWKVENQGNALDQSGELYQAPMLTKTWFHTGAFLDKERILTHFKKEYWHEVYSQQFPLDPLTIEEPELEDAHLSDAIKALPTDEYREALRACKGMMLRQEIFALDAPENPTDTELKRQLKPYTVATHNCNIRLLQPRVENNYGVFIATESEAISISYERDETDYRLSHTLNTKIDDLGNILESAAVVYGRKQDKAEADFQSLSDTITDFSEDVLYDDGTQKTQLQNAFAGNVQTAKDEQTKTHIIYTQNSFAKYNDGTTEVDDIDLPHAYRLRLPKETKTYELTGVSPENEVFQLQEMSDALSNTNEINYNQTPTDGVSQKRLIEHIQTNYLKDDLSVLDVGLYDTIGLPHEAYQLAYTSELVTEIFSKNGVELEADNQTVLALMEDQGKYVNIDNRFWIRSGITHYKDSVNESIDNVRERFYMPIAFEDPFGAKTSVIYDTETLTDAVRDNNGYYLFIRETEDELNNKSQVAVFNYRTLSPSRMIDINANPSSVLLDELGMVKALAAEGNGVYADETRTSVDIIEVADNLNGLKEFEETAGSDSAAMSELLNKATFNSTTTDELRTLGNELLQGATARFAYDFDRYKTTGTQPTVVASITREEHFEVNNNSKIQFGYEYSDGGGNVAMTKSQAEPGLAKFMEDGIQKEKNTGIDQRWIGNGRTVLNNKGNPVKQYEPYFSTNFLYEDAPELVERGVTPILFYDSLGRLIKTKFPDGTLSRVEFDSWKQKTFDQNDTVLEPECLWFQRRTDNTHPEFIADPKEQAVAQEAEDHANTPSIVCLDSLGRPVLSIEHNGKDGANKNRLYTTLIQLDIEGNAREVFDARGNPVMAYNYDMLGHRVYQKSMDTGERWMFNNLMGNPVHRWDSKDQVFTTEYDAVQRPERMFVRTQGEGRKLTNKIIYGESQPDAETNNLRGQVFQTFDSSGMIRNLEHDFKGNPLRLERQLASAFDSKIIDWSQGSPTNGLDSETFTSITEYDALNRMTRHYNWHQRNTRVAVYEPIYNERGVLVAEDHTTNAQKTASGFESGRRITAVSNIQYDEKGQRMKMRLGNGTTTKYHYDSLTFRLIQLRTTRNTVNEDMPVAPSNLLDDNVLQNLYYTYDPVGNIMEIEDDAFKPVFFNNEVAAPKNRYLYDAVYRLVEAGGRENNTFNTASTAKEPNPIATTFPVNDQTLRNYTQTYLYDPVGNILQMRHLTNTTTERWTRRYEYATDSNRLLHTRKGSDFNEVVDYEYDDHGNMLNYNNTDEEFRPQWDYQDRVHQINLGGGGTAFYQYESNLERSRKRIEKAGGIIEERIYLGGMERYRKRSGNQVIEEIETHHLFVDDQRVLMVEDVITTNNNNLDTGILDRYQYSSHLGSVGLELNKNGQIISYEEYHPYGTVAYHAQDKSINSIAKRYRYTAMERDTESGLNYHSARYYLPWLGRWLSGDPIGIEGGGSLYAYSMNNPVIFFDKDGMRPEPGIAPVPNPTRSEIEFMEETARVIRATNNRNKSQSYFISSVKAGAGFIYGVGESAIKGVAGTAKTGYNFVGNAAYYLTGSDIYKDQHEAAVSSGAELIEQGRHPVRTISTVLEDKRKAFGDALSAEDPFEAGRVLGNTAESSAETLLGGKSAFGKLSKGKLKINSTTKTQKRNRLPKEGTWTGKPGDSDFIPDKSSKLPHPEDTKVVDLKTGEAIPFKNGKPDFSRHAVDEFDVMGLDGSNKDFGRIHLALAERYGLVGKKGKPTAEAGRIHLKRLGLAPHHAGGSKVQLIPHSIHGSSGKGRRIGISHTGGAFGLRNELIKRFNQLK